MQNVLALQLFETVGMSSPCVSAFSGICPSQFSGIDADLSGAFRALPAPG